MCSQSVCLFDNGRTEKAIQTLIDNDEQKFSSLLEMYYKTAILYCDKQAFAKAIRKLNRIKATEQSQSSEIRENLEIVLENLGLLDRAFANWKRLEQTSEKLLEMRQSREQGG